MDGGRRACWQRGRTLSAPCHASRTLAAAPRPAGLLQQAPDARPAPCPRPACLPACLPPFPPAVFSRFADHGIAVYSGDIVGHGRSEGHRAVVDSYQEAVSAAAEPVPRGCRWVGGGAGGRAAALGWTGLLRARRPPRPSLDPRQLYTPAGLAANPPKQTDEFLALCEHARQDVAARYPAASPAWFIGG